MFSQLSFGPDGICQSEWEWVLCCSVRIHEFCAPRSCIDPLGTNDVYDPIKKNECLSDKTHHLSVRDMFTLHFRHIRRHLFQYTEALERGLSNSEMQGAKTPRCTVTICGDGVPTFQNVLSATLYHVEQAVWREGEGTVPRGHRIAEQALLAKSLTIVASLTWPLSMDSVIARVGQGLVLSHIQGRSWRALRCTHEHATTHMLKVPRGLLRLGLRDNTHAWNIKRLGHVGSVVENATSVISKLEVADPHANDDFHHVCEFIDDVSRQMLDHGLAETARKFDKEFFRRKVHDKGPRKAATRDGCRPGPLDQMVGHQQKMT